MESILSGDVGKDMDVVDLTCAYDDDQGGWELERPVR